MRSSGDAGAITAWGAMRSGAAALTGYVPRPPASATATMSGAAILFRCTKAPPRDGAPLLQGGKEDAIKTLRDWKEFAAESSSRLRVFDGDPAKTTEPLVGFPRVPEVVRIRRERIH